MSFKTTAILLALAVAGGAIVLLTGEKPPPSAEADDAGGEATYVLAERPERDDVVRLVFERQGQPRLVFERSGEKDESGQLEEWRMLAPFESATENYAVNGLVTMLTGLQYKTRLEPGAAVDAGSTGLEPPRATLAATDKAGKTYALDIGEKAALSNDTYVRVAGGQDILVTQRDLSFDLKKKTSDFRAKSLIKGLKRDKAVHARVAYEGATYEFEKSGDDWVILSPVKAHANKSKVLDLIGALGTVRAEEFVEDAPTTLEPFHLSEPMLSIEVRTEDQKVVMDDAPGTESQPIEPRIEKTENTYRLLIGEFADLESTQRYVKLPDQPWVASVRQSSLERLFPKLNELRDPKVTRAKAADITRIELTVGDETAALLKEDGAWRGSGDLAQLEDAAVQDVLNGIEDLSAIEFINQPGPASEYGLVEPRASLAITTRNALEPVKLKIGGVTPSGRNAHVQVEGQQSVQVVTETQAARVAVPFMSLRSRVIMSTTPEAIRHITLERGDKRYSVQREGESWRLEEPAGAPLDQASVRELVTDLSKLRAARVVAKVDDGSYGLQDPAVSIRFVVDETPPMVGPAAPSEPSASDESAADATPAQDNAEPDGDTPEAVEPAADPGEASAQDSEGESAPDADSTREPEDSVAADEPAPEAAAEAAHSQPAAPSPAGPAPVAHTLLVGVAGEKRYCVKDDEPYIFELDETVFAVLTNELIERGLFKIAADQIQDIAIDAPGGAVRFARGADKEWQYTPDPSVKLSQKKVNDFAKELAELRVNAYLAYSEGDLTEAGLEAAPVTATIGLTDGATITLKVDQVRRGELPRKAAWVEQRRIFLLRPGDAETLLRGLDYYAKSEAGAQERGGTADDEG